PAQQRIYEFARHRLRPSIIDPQVVAIRPTQLLQALKERCQTSLPFRTVCGHAHQHTDSPHPLGLLRPRRDRPCRRAAEQCDELAPPDHLITSSARTRRDGGTVSPSALAVFRLRTIRIWWAPVPESLRSLS